MVKASASLSASAHSTSFGYIVTARPCVKAVGLFRVRFRQQDGVLVRLAEVYVDDGELREGDHWDFRDAFGQQYVDAGEELRTTVTFAPVQAAPTVVGWAVLLYLTLATPTRLAKFQTARWTDQVFVARPGTPQ